MAGTWSCSACTLRNPDSATECDACGGPRPAAAGPAPGAAAGGAGAGAPRSEWSCTVCTLINGATATECNACGSPAPAGGSSPAPAPAPAAAVAPAAPAAAPAVQAAGGGTTSRGKRTFPDKDPQDLLAEPPRNKKRAQDGALTNGASSSLSQEESNSLVRLIFGDKPEASDIERWLGAGFRFSEVKGTEWGLWQQQGGPCGVLAPVQAFMLRHLLFGEEANGEDQAARKAQPLLFAGAEEADARPAVLAYALAAILFHSTPTSAYVVCQVQMGSGAILDDAVQLASGGTLSVQCQRVSSIAEVQRLLEAGATSWLSKPGGVLSFIVSVLCSRTLDRVKEDADDPGTPLIGRFGHCSQELVNLMLIGEAISNVFDGTRWLGDDPSTGMLVKGVDSEKVGVPPVGYLSELEAMRYIAVGTLYKHPDFPLWVLGSPTHYTLLFSTRRSDSALSESALLDQRAKKVFVENSVDDGGIAMSAHLGKMLQALDIQANLLSQAQSELVNEDIVIWADFRAWVRRMKGVQDTASQGPSKLDLFLYDGQDPPGPTLRTIVLEVSDVDPSLAVASDGDAFASTLQTRWPNAVVTVAPFALASSN
eukprot:TRINITY_DN12539_c0_g1_i1.p1 TRINITY_DN12539_c0_g1~~TRINITY_DN12539_c0_g1_i1.p1  ORF type:complete len:595 (+),score=149.65 TRINITY_DN12539_c0_g1_i1:225-2009(+)